MYYFNGFQLGIERFTLSDFFSCRCKLYVLASFLEANGTWKKPKACICEE